MRATAAMLAGLLVASSAGAQFFNPFERRPAPDPRYAPPLPPPPASPFSRPQPVPQPGYYPGRPAPAPYYDRRSDGFFVDPGRVLPQRNSEPNADDQRIAEEQRARAAAARKRAAERARARALERAAAEAAKPKVEASTHIVVFGDTFAELVGAGIDEAFADNPGVAVVRKPRGDSGLVRTDHYDWPKTIRETIAGGQKISFAVLMLGANDRQAIREGDVSHEFLSERWRVLYGERIANVILALKEKSVPFIWVGGPPMRNERQSADMVALNEMFRERVQREGGIYVDIWPGFVDDENHYAASGPDVAGQVARLRTQDGINFTRAGARKAAHFVDIELKRLLGDTAGTTLASFPGSALPPGSLAPGTTPAPTIASPRDAARDAEIDRQITASLPLLPEPPDLISPSSRPAAGPVVPLTVTDVAANGALAATLPRFEGDAAFIAERALREGIAPPPRAGRADDFRWPRI